MKRFLLRHVGNMGDMVFFVPPVLAALKQQYPDCHITLVTAWGFKDARGRWGKRNQGGYSLHLMMTNPHIDKLVHWHDHQISLEQEICQEEGQVFETWNGAYWQQQKQSGKYDGVHELDVGLRYDDNPTQRMFKIVGLPPDSSTLYQLHLTGVDVAVAQAVTDSWPRPRIALLEGLAASTTRGWDPDKVAVLFQKVHQLYGTSPRWFGAKTVPLYEGRPLTLRQNIATLTFCDIGVGVLSGPLHFAAAVHLPTITLYGDQPVHRGAPAYFQNPYLPPASHHRTLLGPTSSTWRLQKNTGPATNLTPAEAVRQDSRGWQQPGRQATKSCVAVITVDEVLLVIQDMLMTAESNELS